MREHIRKFEPKRMTVTVRCPQCNRDREIAPVTEEQFDSWRSGMLIQRAMPLLSRDDREGLISGYCTTCWNKAFKDD